MDYVSPFDERTLVPQPLAPRPASVAGRRVALLDIAKTRGEELLDRLQELLEERGCVVSRFRKPTFSRPAPPELLEQVALHGDLAVEGLAD